MTTSDEQLRLARAYLAAVAEPPAPGLAQFVADCGPIRAAERVRNGRVPAAVSEEVEPRRGWINGEDVVSATAEASARLVIPEDADWPVEPLTSLREARAVGIAGVAEPLALWARGRASLAELLDSAVSIVGARAASGYGEHVSAELAHGVATAGWTVVSGAAYGIDGAAHRGALGAGRRSIAFLACGIDRDYPSGHTRLLRALADQGVVLSEYPPGSSPRRHRFLVRNRLIAAVGGATVVVEAAARSGAVSTANHADALGHPVLAVPGPVTARNSVGCHELIRSGRAVLVTGPADLLEVLQPLGGYPDDGWSEPGASSTQAPTQPQRDSLPALGRDVLDALAAGATAAEEVAIHVGVPVGKVRALLPELEFAGFVRRDETGWSARDT